MRNSKGFVKEMKEKLDYKKAGVDISAGEEAVDRIKPLVKKTFNKNVLAELGGFGGLYEIDLQKWNYPVLVSSTDGVGTKLMLAKMASVFDTVGQDLVNHCVNDILVQGAEPQFFMDYIGVGMMSPPVIEEIVKGLTTACSENSMALIGGEMAEMPGIYQKDDFDLVGTIVGLVEKNKIINGTHIEEGDVLIGLPSTGLHTNGYSLARNILFDKLKLKIDSYVEDLSQTVAESMLAIHKSYLSEVMPFIKEDFVKGMAHITGGGIEGNLKRIIPDNKTAVIDTDKWDYNPIFNFLQSSGEIEKIEMFKTFNMGIGFIIVSSVHHSENILKIKDSIKIGHIENYNQKKVVLRNI